MCVCVGGGVGCVSIERHGLVRVGVSGGVGGVCVGGGVGGEGWGWGGVGGGGGGGGVMKG